MKIAINSLPLVNSSIRGWSRYTIELLAGLAGLGVELILYANRDLATSHLSRLPVGSYDLRIAPPMRALAWEQLWLPRQIEADQVDLVHCPFNYGLPWKCNSPQVLTLHDAIFHRLEGGARNRRKRWSYASARIRLSHWIARVRADRIITVSHHARQDLLDCLGIPAHKVVVIYEAADARFHRPVDESHRLRVRRAHNLPDRYLFYVGGWEERKNLPFLIRALANTPGDFALVLAGGREAQRDGLADLARDLGVAERLHLLGWVEDADLPALYAEALAFVYPSRYEGFGLQLCEAMATGCPTLATRVTSLPEVLGNGGETFSLDDISELSELLHRVSSDADYRQELSARARNRSKSFTWRRTAEETFAVYQKLMIENKRGD